MKPLSIAIILATLLTGCETTTTNEDGSVSTNRFDAKGATDAVATGLNTWQQIDRQSRVVGYDQFGNPIYRQ